MYEFHGWATIYESPKEMDEGHLERVVTEIQMYISQKEWFNAHVELYWANGIPLLTISGCRNHKAAIASDIFELYELISKSAPGSYGTLYVSDDEEPHHQNEFQVFVMARGTIEKVKDSLLSPIVPKILDEINSNEV